MKKISLPSTVLASAVAVVSDGQWNRDAVYKLEKSILIFKQFYTGGN